MKAHTKLTESPTAPFGDEPAHEPLRASIAQPRKLSPGGYPTPPKSPADPASGEEVPSSYSTPRLLAPEASPDHAHADRVVFLEQRAQAAPPSDREPLSSVGASASVTLAIVSALGPPLSAVSLLALRGVTGIAHMDLLSSLLRLIGAGLVETTDHPTGRSALAVRLTPPGRTLAREISENAATGRPRMLARGAS